MRKQRCSLRFLSAIDVEITCVNSASFSLATFGVVRALLSPLQYVYEIFLASAACHALAAACSYSYFVLMWNKHCPSIRLKKAMRFTKCDTCVLASEALDQARRNGGGGWQTEAMTVIKRTLEDHYQVRLQSSSGRLQCALAVIFGMLGC